MVARIEKSYANRNTLPTAIRITPRLALSFPGSEISLAIQRLHGSALASDRLWEGQEIGHQDRVDVLTAAPEMALAEALALEAEGLV